MLVYNLHILKHFLLLHLQRKKLTERINDIPILDTQTINCTHTHTLEAHASEGRKHKTMLHLLSCETHYLTAQKKAEATFLQILQKYSAMMHSVRCATASVCMSLWRLKNKIKHVNKLKQNVIHVATPT